MLKLVDISKQFRLGGKLAVALSRVSFSLEKGEVLGLIGESGSGKSTLAKIILRLLSPSEGKIYFEGEEITHKRTKHLSKQIQIVFQDPFSSLNPSLTIEQILKEPTQIHGLPHRVDELLSQVHLSCEIKTRYPKDLSGGQRQRVAIARAIALNPKLLVCDEPISSLDLPIQAQILNLLVQCKQTLGLTMIFITHDMAALRYISDRIAILEKGRLREIDLFTDAREKSAPCKEPLSPESFQKTF